MALMLIVGLMVHLASIRADSNVNVNVGINYKERSGLGTGGGSPNVAELTDNAEGPGGSQSGKACMFGYTVYFNGDTLEDVCLEMICVDGKWVYTAQLNPQCGECNVYGEPHVLLYRQERMSGSVRYATGNFAISQPGFDVHPLYGVSSNFVKCQGDLTCVESATYIEPEINVTMVTHPILNCNDPSTCIIKVFVNGKERTMSTSVQSYWGKDGNVLVFKHNHIKTDRNLNCINVVGSKGFSVSLCQNLGDYTFLYVWAMPKLQNSIYGLCDTFPGTDDWEYTTRSDTKTPTYDVSLESWKLEGNSARSKRKTIAMEEILGPTYTFTKLNRCIEPAVKRDIQDKCNKTMRLCQTHTGPFYDSCVFDLCNVENPDRYLAGYSSHVLVHKQLSPYAPKCSCTFRTVFDRFGIPISSGCHITKAVPWALIACRCSLLEWIPRFCIGTVVLCKDYNSYPCFYPGTGKPSCEEGDGNCGGYPIWP